MSLSPFNGWLFIQGLETLALRMKQHVENAEQIAQFLAEHDQVSWVNYPTLKDNPQEAIARTYLRNGAGSIFTFGIKGGLEAAKKFISSVKLFSHVANVGDSKSLVIHPASTTHSRLSEEDRKSTRLNSSHVAISYA